MPRDWDAATYDRVAAPMTARGTALLDRRGWRGDERVLDAGCGSGRVTSALLERLPDGEVVALDGSAAMVAEARRVLGEDPRVSVLEADLEVELPFADAAFDVVVSTSTFHWVPDHPALWRRLARVLRPGGVLLADFGGAGNIASVLRALEEEGEGGWSPWTFEAPEDARAGLVAAGFVPGSLEVDHVPDPVRLDPAEVETYLRTVVLGSHVERLGPEAGTRLVAAVAARLPEPAVDYWRLQVHARLP